MNGEWVWPQLFLTLYIRHAPCIGIFSNLMVGAENRLVYYKTKFITNRTPHIHDRYLQAGDSEYGMTK